MNFLQLRFICFYFEGMNCDKMKIGIYGSAAGDISLDISDKAREVGRQIAQRRHIVITGGCLGLPNEAVLGAHELRGEAIAYSPATTLEEHIEKYKMPAKGFTDFVFVPADYKHAKDKRVCLKYRNVSSVADADAAIIISGRIGTMNEFTIAYDLGKKIGVLTKTGGITREAIQVLLRDAKKETGAEIVYASTPFALVEKITRDCRTKPCNFC